MKKLLFLFLIGFLTTASAQTKASVSKGTLMLYDKRVISFTNLRFVDNTVMFINNDTASEFTYFLTSIRTITDDAGAIVFSQSEEHFAVKETSSAPEPQPLPDDGFFRIDYPEGLYLNKEQFIAKKPGYTGTLVPKGLYGFTKPVLQSPEHNCYFYYEDTDERVRRAFAVSYKGHLYFSVYAILSNRNKTDRAQTNDTPNAFVMVMDGGTNYLYTEANLANAWAQGLAYNAGAAGSIMAQNLAHGKGVVWDFKNQEFNIFKNCKDYNDFIKDKYAAGIQSCENQQPDVMKIREAIARIK